MTPPKPVTVYRSDLTGQWYACVNPKPVDGRPGLMKADATKRDVANSDQLEKLFDANTWLNTLLHHTGKTREQIAADYDLVIHDDH